MARRHVHRVETQVFDAGRGRAVKENRRLKKESRQSVAGKEKTALGKQAATLSMTRL